MVNGCIVKELLAISHWFKSLVSAYLPKKQYNTRYPNILFFLNITEGPQEPSPASGRPMVAPMSPQRKKLIMLIIYYNLLILTTLNWVNFIYSYNSELCYQINSLINILLLIKLILHTSLYI